MPENQDRITRIETRQDHMDTILSRLDETTQKIGDALQKLLVAEAERAADRSAIQRIFGTLEQHEGKLLAIETARKDREIADLKSEIQEKREREKALAAEMFRTALAIGAALTLYHYGVRP